MILSIELNWVVYATEYTVKSFIADILFHFQVVDNPMVWPLCKIPLST
jgi:hypothetical protein